MIRLKYVLKRFASRPFDRDRAVEMSSPPFHLSRYNLINSRTCADHLRWTAGTSDRRSMIDEPSIRCSIFGHVTCIQNNSVELSPTWRRLNESIGFIRCSVSEG